ncbi:hypothetical protein LMG28140_01578 [Paraburkholderia metrosideri]|uniref:Pyridine nucleotide-disulfide oxidoreductase n=2 Tax=Paraburkholderia metrosideri TaxID=580937 RepID=A0ABM8NGH3_9BURK|nr:hypothetical protein LMG28140_01578 [Paraburkholderia metrosideri]
MNRKTYVPSLVRSARTEFSCAICGAGPSGMGFLFHAFKTGKLPEIARNGLLIIDRGLELGAGKLGEYANVTGNTVGNTFLACLEHENFEEVFGDLRRHSPLHKQMVDAADGPPMLTEAGALLALATERLLAYLTARYDVTVLRGREIDKVRRLKNGGFEIDYHDVDNASSLSTVSADTVVMNLGGLQRVGEIDELCRGLGLPPPDADVRTYVSDDVLSLTTTQLADEFSTDLSQQGTGRKKRITVVGGSHSAFTTVDRLAMELGSEGLEEITVIHRSPVRLFFETIEEARATGYVVDEANDVCPVTKRVNRAGGLRYRAFDIARSIMATGHVPGTMPHVELIEPDSSEDAWLRARDCLRESIAVIHGAGYGPNMSVLVDHRDTPIALQLGQGGVVSDRFGCPFDANGDLIQGLFSFGLGSGFRPDEQIRRETGFEAAFRGRIYGVWAFHHDFGGRVLNGVLEALAAVPVVAFTREAVVLQDEHGVIPEVAQLTACDAPAQAVSPQT